VLGSMLTKITLAGLAWTAATTMRVGDGHELAATWAPDSRRRTSAIAFSEVTSTSLNPMNDVLPSATVEPSGESAGATAYPLVRNELRRRERSVSGSRRAR